MRLHENMRRKIRKNIVNVKISVSDDGAGSVGKKREKISGKKRARKKSVVNKPRGATRINKRPDWYQRKESEKKITK